MVGPDQEGSDGLRAEDRQTGLLKAKKNIAECVAGCAVDPLAFNVAASRCSLFSHLRSSVDVRHAAQRRRRCGRMGHAVAEARRCEGVQEILADEATDEARGAGEVESPS